MAIGNNMPLGNNIPLGNIQQQLTPTQKLNYFTRDENDGLPPRSVLDKAQNPQNSGFYGLPSPAVTKYLEPNEILKLQETSRTIYDKLDDGERDPIILAVQINSGRPVNINRRNVLIYAKLFSNPTHYGLHKELEKVDIDISEIVASSPTKIMALVQLLRTNVFHELNFSVAAPKDEKHIDPMANAIADGGWLPLYSTAEFHLKNMIGFISPESLISWKIRFTRESGESKITFLSLPKSKPNTTYAIWDSVIKLQETGIFANKITIYISHEIDANSSAIQRQQIDDMAIQQNKTIKVYTIF